jgi:Plastocyanin
MNCEAGILSNTGAVYEHTFTQAGPYSYFCFLHCFAGMTGVINVTPPVGRIQLQGLARRRCLARSRHSNQPCLPGDSD